MDHGVFIPRTETEQTTLSEALERYALEVVPNKALAAQPAEHRRILALRCRPIASMALARISGRIVTDYIRERQAEGVGANTIRLDLASISHLYTVARTAWGIPSLTNPVPLAKSARPRLPSGRTRRLESGEEGRLLDAASPGLRPVIRFALATAMPRAEIAGLTWAHVDLKQRSAHLPKTKNGTVRTVPLSREALSILQSLPRRLGGRVFGMGENTITNAMFMASRSAGITGLTFHDLQHESISRLFENTDLDAVEIARISGYTHRRAQRRPPPLPGAPRGPARTNGAKYGAWGGKGGARSLPRGLVIGCPLRPG